MRNGIPMLPNGAGILHPVSALEEMAEHGGTLGSQRSLGSQMSMNSHRQTNNISQANMKSLFKFP